MSEDLPAPEGSAGGTYAGLAEARPLSAAVISIKSPVSLLEKIAESELGCCGSLLPRTDVLEE